MKILCINLPYYGHVVPTIGLVQACIKQNCEVTYLMPFDWEDVVKESGALFHGYKNHKQLSEQIKNAYKEAENIIQDYDLILYEQFFFLGKHLAEKYNKPVVRLFTAPIANKQLMQEYIKKGPLSIFKSQWIAKAFTKDIAKNIPLKTDNWLDEIIENAPALNLIYTLAEYQPYVEEYDTTKYKFIGPSIYSRKKETFAFKKRNRPVIYISLGSIVKGSTSFFTMCMQAFKDENVDIILNVGNKFNINKLKNIPSNIHIYTHVPQTQVLEMSDVFITHGGMNSINEALTYKVAMLVIPFVSDQPINAKNIEKMGVGVTLQYDTLTKEILKNKTFYVLNNPSIKDNLNIMHTKIANSLGNDGGAKAIIDFYYKEKGE